LHGRNTATAAFVVNDERHTQLLGELGTNGARHNTRSAAWCKGNDPPHCFFGPAACLTKRWQTSSRQTSSTHPLEVIATIYIFKRHNSSIQIFVSWNMPQMNFALFRKGFLIKRPALSKQHNRPAKMAGTKKPTVLPQWVLIGLTLHWLTPAWN
jgi:hypothetical protein